MIERLLAEAIAGGAIYPIDVLDFAKARGLDYPTTRALNDAWLAQEDPRARYRREQAAEAFADAVVAPLLDALDRFEAEL